MNLNEAKILHELLYTFMGQFHEKVLIKFRQVSPFPSWVKKNHSKIINLLYQRDYLTLTEIGKRLDIEKGSLTTLIDQMEEKGFVIRSDDPCDRRKSLISLSPQSRTLMDQVMDLHTQELNEIFENVDSSEVQQFLSSLQNVVDFMKRV